MLDSCFKTFFICTFNANKAILLFTFYLNGGLYAVYIGKPFERMCAVRFLKMNLKLNFGFPHIPFRTVNHRHIKYSSLGICRGGRDECTFRPSDISPPRTFPGPDNFPPHVTIGHFPRLL